MYAIKGYKVNKLSLKKAESVLDEAKKKIEVIATKRYYDLLSAEIENLVDNIVLGSVSKAPDKSIFEMATDILNNRIAVATSRRDNIEFNLSATAYILTHENDTYIELSSVTEIYDSVFPNIDRVEDCSVIEGESILPSDDPNYAIWKEIINKYNKETFLTMRLYPIRAVPKPSFNQLTFNSVEVRADRKARHHVANILLGAYGGGEQIPPHKLMEYMDSALLRTTDAAMTPIIKQEMNKLTQILPVITEELINKV